MNLVTSFYKMKHSVYPINSGMPIRPSDPLKPLFAIQIDNLGIGTPASAKTPDLVNFV